MKKIMLKTEGLLRFAAALLIALIFTASAPVARADDPVLYANADAKIICLNGSAAVLEAGEAADKTKIVIGSQSIDLNALKTGTASFAGDAAGGYDLSACSVYGGFYNSNAEGSTKFSMTGGRVGALFGGCCNTGDSAQYVSANTSVTLSGGTVVGGVYGGGADFAGEGCRVLGNSSVTVSGGSAGFVHGGSYAASNGAALSNGRITVQITGGEIKGSVYAAGRNEGSGSSKTSQLSKMYITVSGGSIAGDIYGGAWGANAQSGRAYITLAGGAVAGRIYGGGDKSAVYSSAITVKGGSLNSGITLGGASASAAVTKSAEMHVAGGSVDGTLELGALSASCAPVLTISGGSVNAANNTGRTITAADKKTPVYRLAITVTTASGSPIGGLSLDSITLIPLAQSYPLAGVSTNASGLVCPWLPDEVNAAQLKSGLDYYSGSVNANDNPSVNGYYCTATGHISLDGVITVDTAKKRVMANGNAITLAEGSSETKTKIIYNGVSQDLGISGGDPDGGYDLSAYFVFGGSSWDKGNSVLRGNTSITVNGGRVKEIYGGGCGSAVIGDTSVVATSIAPRETNVADCVYGGGRGVTEGTPLNGHFALVEGATHVTIDTGWYDEVWGGGYSVPVPVFSARRSNVTVTYQAQIKTLYGGSGGGSDKAIEEAVVTVSGGSIDKLYAAGHNHMASSRVEIQSSGSTYPAQIKNIYLGAFDKWGVTARIKSITANIEGGETGSVYFGSSNNSATVEEVALTVSGGTIKEGIKKASSPVSKASLYISGGSVFSNASGYPAYYSAASGKRVYRTEIELRDVGGTQAGRELASFTDNSGLPCGVEETYIDAAKKIYVWRIENAENTEAQMRISGGGTRAYHGSVVTKNDDSASGVFTLGTTRVKLRVKFSLFDWDGCEYGFGLRAADDTEYSFGPNNGKGVYDMKIPLNEGSYTLYVNRAGVKADIRAVTLAGASQEEMANFYPVLVQGSAGTSNFTGAGVYATGESITLDCEVETEHYDFKRWVVGTDEVAATKRATLTMRDASTLYHAVAEPFSYTVRFGGNHSTSGSMPDRVSKFDEYFNLPRNLYVREGYTFRDWSCDKPEVFYANEEEVHNLTTVKNGVFNLYARWTENNYKVRFNANGGSGAMADQSFSYDEQKQLTANAFTRSGYTFAGWSRITSGERQYLDREYVWKLTTEQNGVVVLYACWTANAYSVHFSANGGTGTMSDQSFTYDVAQNLTKKPDTMTNGALDFTGWNTAADGTGTSYADEQSVKNMATEKDAIVTLFAQWEESTHSTLNYIVNDGGMGSVSRAKERVVKPDGTAQGSTATANTGRHFVQWTLGGALQSTDPVFVPTAPDGGWTEKSYSYCAEFAANTYAVHFDGGGATGGAMDNESFTWGVAQALTANAFTRTGYVFEGWSADTSAASVTYYDGEYVISLTDVNNGVVNLTAVWKPVNYTVAFDANGGEGTMASMAFVYDTAQNLTANAFSRVGYTFAGWATASGATSAEYTDTQSVSNLASTEGAVATLYAVWSPIHYQLSFDVNGGEGSMAAMDFTYKQTQPLTANAFTRAGYQFFGWADSAESAYGEYADGSDYAYAHTQNHTLFAVWFRTPDATLEYYSDNLTGGLVSPASERVTATRDATGSSASASAGYHFTEWQNENGDSVASSAHYTPERPVPNYFSASYYAEFEPNTYAVRFNSNGGAGSMANESFVYDREKALTANAFSNTGHIFEGWATSADGDAEYYDGEIVSNLTAVNGGTVDLYAVWEAAVYTLSFDANGGGGDMQSITIQYSESRALPENRFSRADHDFTGWSLDPNAPAPTWADKATYTCSSEGDVTLYAVWCDVSEATLFYLPEPLEGGGTSPVSEVVSPTADAQGSSASANTGYHFSFWTNESGVEVSRSAHYTPPRPDPNYYTTTFFANFAANRYSVRFNASGGSGAMLAQQFSYGASQNLTPNAFVKKGSAFAGWAASESGAAVYTDAQRVKNLTSANGATVDLYAVWQPQDYTVSFNANGGTGAPSTITARYGESVTLPSAAGMSRTGYIFVGWAATSGAAAPVYRDQETFDYPYDRDLALFAVWARNGEATLYYLASPVGFGSVAPASESVSNTVPAAGSTASASAGYHFNNWTNANGVSVATSARYTPPQPTGGYITTAYTANFAANSYAVAFNLGGATGGTMSAQSFTYGVEQALTKKPDAIVKTGFDFMGWAASESGAVVYADGASVKNITAQNNATVTLYAVWKAPVAVTVQPLNAASYATHSGEFPVGAYVIKDAGGRTIQPSDLVFTAGGVPTMPYWNYYKINDDGSVSANPASSNREAARYKIRIGNPNITAAGYTLTFAEGELTVRGSSELPTQTLTSAVESPSGASAPTIIAPRSALFYNSQGESVGYDSVALFADDSLGAEYIYMSWLAPRTSGMSGMTGYQYYFLGAVDSSDALNKLHTSGRFTVFLPYPAGANAGMDFAVLHFAGYDREPGQDITEASLELITNVRKHANGVSFEVSDTSPFALGWKRAAPKPDPNPEPRPNPNTSA